MLLVAKRYSFYRPYPYYSQDRQKSLTQLFYLSLISVYCVLKKIYRTRPTELPRAPPQYGVSSRWSRFRILYGRSLTVVGNVFAECHASCSLNKLFLRWTAHCSRYNKLICPPYLAIHAFQVALESCCPAVSSIYCWKCPCPEYAWNISGFTLSNHYPVNMVFSSTTSYTWVIWKG